MLREDVLRAVEERLELMSGLRAKAHLTGDFRDEVIGAERRSEQEGALGGLMPLSNEGFWHVLEREEQYVLVLDRNSSVIRLAPSLLQLRDGRGNLIGEWLPPHRAEALKGKEHVHFLSDDFVLYRNVLPDSEPRVVLPEVEFPFLYGTESIANVTSASPSVLADEVIRRRLSKEGPGLLSHVVGFDIRADVLGPACRRHRS